MDCGSHNRQKKAAVINDFSSFGRCSLAVAVPILAAQKVQCCPVPTAFFTNHTGFKHFTFCDLTDRMEAYITDWQATGLAFDAISSGYLASRRQLDFISRFVETFSSSRPCVFVDPVMGDYGRLYPSYDPKLAEAMRELLPIADVLTPNLTEACILAGREYSPLMSESEICEIAAEISAPNARDVVISGVPRGTELVNYIFERGTLADVCAVSKLGPDRSGTGDVFSSAVLGAVVRGMPFNKAVRLAADFVAASVRRAIELDIPVTDGLPIEETLPMLCL